MKKLLLLSLLLFSVETLVFATGEPSTYFNIFVPSNNDAVQRDVSLIVTAIYDSTYFEIIDDDFDGDSDDSKSGYLMAGQSYVLYIKDNGINDDARYASGGVLKRDGDYFTIRSDKLVYASQSTKSDWQHDWVPSIDKSSVGEKFILYVPPGSYSNRDLNVFAFEDGETNVSIRKISITPTIITSFTNVNDSIQDVVANFTVSPGIDAIHATTPGRNLLESGATYIVESNKKISVQYGALWQNERDGGGYVPSSNGSSSGELFYFAVPYQVSLEQEVRIVSWDDDNEVELTYYNGSSWVNLDNWTLNELQTGDWVGKNVGESHQNVFRVECTAGKKVSVFEANWLETGSPGTSDIATMVSSEAGTTAGDRFLVYMAPPGYEYNVVDPFTGEFFQYPMTHAYIFAGNDTVNVTVKDAYTEGAEINRTYQILPGRYIDCALNLEEWRSIYNGDGNPNSGQERPYLLIESDNSVSVMNTNFNDNWMMYFGTSLDQGFVQESIGSESMVSPGENIIVSTDLILNTTNDINNVSAEVIVGSGLEIVSSEFVNNTDGLSYDGDIQTSGSESKAVFDSLPDLDPAKSYSINTEITGSVNYNNNQPVEDGTVVTVESTVTGAIDGQIEQSVITQGLEMDTDNTAFMLFSKLENATTSENTDSWNSNWVDVNNDGWDDLYVTTYDKTKSNILYINNGNGTFTSVSAGDVTAAKGGVIASSWADIDNDGDLDVYNAHNIDSKDGLYSNEGNLEFSSEAVSLLSKTNGYHHGAVWADYDNDGFVDVFISDFMPTRFNVLLKNNGNGTFSEVNSEPMTQVTGRSIGATWADYNNDGFQDLFVPNGNKENNALYKNLGNGHFEKVEGDVVVQDASNAVGSCWGDFDNDKDLDLFVTTASGGKNLFYANNGDGTFTKIDEGNPSNDKGNSHGCSFVDVDNNGWLDLYVINDQDQAKFLYLNKGDGTFTKNHSEVVTSALGNTYSDSWSDFDRDGDLDLYVSTHSNEENLFFINNGTDNNWAEFKLIGNLSNKSAIGTRVELKANGVWQSKEVNSQSGFGGQNSILVHFGLGNAENIDSLKILWPSGVVQVLTNQAINTISTIEENEGALVKGNVYLDANSNCIYDEGEQLLSGVALKIDTEENRFYTGKAGVFTRALTTGNHTLEILPDSDWSSCINSFPITINSVNDSVVDLNFGLTAISLFNDLSVTAGATAFRRGFKNSMVLTVKNEGTINSENDTLTLTLPADIHMLGTSNSYLQNGNEYKWVIEDLKIGEEFILQITDSVGLATTVGDSIDFLISVSENNNEVNTNNNSLLMEDQVVGAVDPNDIIVWPKGEGSAGYIAKDQVVSYRVRFQNTGSYYAQHVTIYNELPQIVDPASISNIVSSHDYELTVNGDQLIWTFKNILLPDSSKSDLESQGFVQYSIKTNEQVFGGELLTNSADIVFDYEAPVNTKQVSNTIKYYNSGEANELMIWPNPSANKINMILQHKDFAYETFTEISYCQITDITGKVIYESSVNNAEFGISLDNLNIAAGTYIVKVTDGDGYAYTSTLIKN